MKYPLNLLQNYVDFCKFLSLVFKYVLWNRNDFKQDSKSSTMASFGMNPSWWFPRFPEKLMIIIAHQIHSYMMCTDTFLFNILKMSVTIYMCIHLVIAIRINSLQFNPSLLEKGLSRPTQMEMTTCHRFLTRLQDNVFVSTFRLIPVSFWTVLISC